VGEKYKQYTEPMLNMIGRHTTVDHEVVILGDEATSPLQGWWAKLKIFDPKVFKDYDNVLYIDINQIIKGNIDELILLDTPFAALQGVRPGRVLRDPSIPIGINSGIMKWCTKYKATDKIWDEWNSAPFVTCHGDQQFTGDVMGGDIELIQDLLPGQIASFKDEYDPEREDDYRIVCFHGYPKPHEIPDFELVKEHWK
jgi:hypothetical protein